MGERESTSESMRSETSESGVTQRDGGNRGTGLTDEVRQLMRDRAYERLGTQKQKATDNLGTLAGAVRSMTQQLQDSGQPTLAGYVTRAADSIDRFSSRLRDQEIDDALREMQEFARRRPAMFLGMAFGAGVLAARFFKSSAHTESMGGRGRGRQRYPDRPSDAPWSPPGAMSTAERSVAHETPRVGPDIPSGSEVL
jgi:hypothetical protein